MTPYCITTAKQMLDVEELPKDLEQKLLLVETMVQKIKPNGCLSSTQTIATIILQWKLETTMKILTL